MARKNVTSVVQPCPPGMEHLIPTSGIFIRHQIELFGLEVLRGYSYDKNNKFEIIDDDDGKRLYLAAEKRQTNCCVKFCLGSHRPFSILVLNPTGAPCLRIRRSCGLWCLMGFCCNDVEVFTGLDVLVGKVYQPMFNCCCTEFVISDAVGKNFLTVHGPCHLCICCEADFPIMDISGDEIGVIHKQWGGTQCCTSATNFNVVYPANLDPTMKCLLIAAAFLIDFMYYEWKKENYH